MIGVASILRQHGRTALLTQTIPAGGENDATSAQYLSTIADAILTLDYSTQGYNLDREMRVVKTRGSGHEPHPYRLSIQEGGLAVTRMSRQEASAR